MKNSMASLFHAQCYEDAWADYQRALNNPSFACWDYIVLTASNALQAEGFQAQLKLRRLPARTHVAVIPDPDGKRVGSGGATLGVLRYIRQRELSLGHDGFDSLRILVIHSGGDSKRTPQYSALGKLFSPVPHQLPDGTSATLFDEFMISMAGVPARIREGMLLLSGDVLLMFNPLQIDYSGNGAAAISFKEDVQTGKNHGVYLRGANGYVAKCLQKQPVEVLSSLGAVNEQNSVDIDTGAVIFSPEMLSSLYGLIADGRGAQFINEKVRLSLYADFLYPLGEDATLESFYREKPEGDYSDELTVCREAVWKALRPFRMKLLRLAPARFIHFGTTGEIMSLMSEKIEEYASLGWSRQVNSSLVPGVSGYNSVISTGAKVGTPVHLETSYVHSEATVGNHVLLSYVDIHSETIPNNVVLHGLKQRDGRFVVRIYGIQDNPKEDKLFGKPLADMGIAGSLWMADLYPVCSTISEGVRAALNLYEIAMGRGNRVSWELAEKKSLCAGFNDADPDAIIAWDKRMHELAAMDQLAKDIQNKVPVSKLQTRIHGSLTKIQREWLSSRLERADYSEAMRLHYYLSRLLSGAEAEEHVTQAFRIIQRSVLTQIHLQENTSCRITCDRHIVRLPLRVNWGGGWSDTPPYCLENGGTVLNAAILLDGKMPVEVTLERLKEKKIVFDSRDMDTHGEFTEIAELQSVGDPYDPFVLQKAALLACGIIPAEGGNLETVLNRLGGGILMRSEVTDVPKGSGLGTSSILAGACVKALFEFTGIPYTEEDLYSHVSVMEQIMSTGGGWQDQVGGLSNGIKYISTMPGLVQNIHVQHLQIPEEAWQELKERFVLIYTGQRRLARNLLRDVVGRYIGNEPESLYAHNEIQRVAALMRFELERGHVDDFAALLDRHWSLSQQIDEGSTNTLLNQIFASIDEFIAGRLVCGAGGGGFLQVVLKRGVTREQVHKRLKEVFQDSAVDVYNATLV